MNRSPVIAGTVKDALEALVAAYPGLRGNLFGADGKLRSFVNVYLNDEDIRYLPAKEDRRHDPTTSSPSFPPLPAAPAAAACCS